MKNYIFRKIEKDELPVLFDIIAARVRWMDEVGIKQWNTTDYLKVYPMEYYEQKRQKGQVFVLESKGEILCGAVLMDEDARWPQAAKALYLHNFASRIDANGVGSIFLDLAEKHAKRKGMTYLRLDSDIDNRPLEKYYSEKGYEAVGSCVDGPYKGTLRQKRLF